MFKDIFFKHAAQVHGPCKGVMESRIPSNKIPSNRIPSIRWQCPSNKSSCIPQ